jgi:hypothetical protein
MPGGPRDSRGALSCYRACTMTDLNDRTTVDALLERFNAPPR